MAEELKYPKYTNLKKKSAYKTPGTREYNERMKEQKNFYTVTGKSAIPLGSAEEEKLRQKWKNENFESSLNNRVTKISAANTSYNFNLNENENENEKSRRSRKSRRKSRRTRSRKNTRGRRR